MNKVKLTRTEVLISPNNKVSNLRALLFCVQ